MNFNELKHIYFCGIGGISMSGLARVLLEKGFKISGSDTKASNITRDLEERGVNIFNSQQESNIKDDIDLFVYTAAVHEDNPEFIKAKEKNIPIMTRAQLLGYVMSKFKESIAISGTHGKTTTTSMLSYILLDSGQDPTISVGGVLKKIKGNIHIGSGDVFVTEACEYTNSFLSLNPTIGVILNIEEDHLDFFKDIEEIRNSFKKFVTNTSDEGCIIINDKIENNEEITENFKGKVVRYGSENSDCFVNNIRYDELGYPTFDLIYKGSTYKDVKLCVGGNHNIDNALASICVAFELGVGIEDIKNGLLEFSGADRRFEIKGKMGNITIVDDYAHHPTEVKVTINAAHNTEKGKVTVIFQPHRYSRTKFFFDDFVKSLKEADDLILLPIYAASEDNTYDVTSESLAEKIGGNVRVQTQEEIEDIIKNDKNSGNTYVFMGAGSVSKIAHEIANDLKKM